jgi:hypothetical protein
MKESTFIELLNLYIDQQIAPEDATRLEGEILNNQRRRRVYQQYCKMHRACTIVLEKYGEEPEGEPVVEFAPPARRAVWGYYAAGVAAAACVTLVVGRIYFQSATSGAPALPAAVPVAAAPVAESPVEALPVRLDVTLPGLRQLGDAALPGQEVLLPLPTYARETPSLVMVNVPATRVPMRPLSVTATPAPDTASGIERFVFQSDQPAPDTAQGYRLRRVTDGKEEMTAYQFQR